MAKITGQANRSNPKRAATVEKYGFDTKFAYHLVRLMLEIEQIMIECDLDLERNSDFLKGIRNGQMTLDQLVEWFHTKERSLEEVYAKSSLPEGPDEPAIKSLLLQCLEHHYGSLDALVTRPNRESELVRELEKLVERYR
jgi:hypothetical protein